MMWRGASMGFPDVRSFRGGRAPPPSLRLATERAGSGAGTLAATGNPKRGPPRREPSFHRGVGFGAALIDLVAVVEDRNGPSRGPPVHHFGPLTDDATWNWPLFFHCISLFAPHLRRANLLSACHQITGRRPPSMSG